LLGVSCTNLEEEVLDGVTISNTSGGTVNSASLLVVSAYEGLRGFETQGQMFALDEMSSDALVGPTRGGDWDDNGGDKSTYTHGPDHVQVRNAWNALLSQVYSCNLVVENGSGSNRSSFFKTFITII
jgi:hypothetical protein